MVCFFMRSIADNFASQTAVDIFNSATGTWSTAKLSVMRRAMGATSVGEIALFAGGGVSDGTFVMEVTGYDIGCVGVDCILLLQANVTFLFAISCCHISNIHDTPQASSRML
jgi:hypothetical protein